MKVFSFSCRLAWKTFHRKSWSASGRRRQMLSPAIVICLSSSAKIKPTAFTSLLPSIPFWEVMSESPSCVTVVVHFLPSVVVSSKGTPSLASDAVISHQLVLDSYLNFSSMLFIVVLVVMVQSPPDSVMVMTGVEAMAAFLNIKPTLRTFRKSSYPSSETRVKVPENILILLYYMHTHMYNDWWFALVNKLCRVGCVG